MKVFIFLMMIFPSFTSASSLNFDPTSDLKMTCVQVVQPEGGFKISKPQATWRCENKLEVCLQTNDGISCYPKEKK